MWCKRGYGAKGGGELGDKRAGLMVLSTGMYGRALGGRNI